MNKLNYIIYIFTSSPFFHQLKNFLFLYNEEMYIAIYEAIVTKTHFRYVKIGNDHFAFN